MLHLLRNNFARTALAGLALILAFAIALLSKAFAYEFRIDINPDPSVSFYAEDSTIQYGDIVSVNHAGKYTLINGAIYLTDDSSSNCAQYFTMSPLERGANLPVDANMTTDSTTGEFSITSDTGLDLSAGDEVLKTYYEIAPEAPNGVVCKVRYNIGYTAEIDGNTEEWTLSDTGGYYNNMIADRNSNDINFYYAGNVVDNVDKTYGDDDFTYTVPSGVTHGATISYASGDENVATVNATTGEVHIVGAGSTTITATAVPYYAYAEGTTSYTLNVAPKSVSIDSAAVPDKTYDGTTASEVGIVELSDMDLIQGADYTATAAFADANVGTDKTVDVTVTLIGDAANNYVLTSNTTTVDNVTISPYSITSNNIALEYYTTGYDMTEKEPGVTVKIGDFTVDGNEYTIGYRDNINPGTAYVTVTAKDNMNITSEAEKSFEIVDGRSILEINGINSSQVITYTGLPVELEGTLTVGDNTDGITVNDLTTTWYEADGITEITQPTNAGNYVVKYSYNGLNYIGELVVSFEIEQAVSPDPVEMQGLSAEAGMTLAEIEGARTAGFSWNDEAEVVTAGRNGYAATYTYNNDTTNYTTLRLEVPVYGLTRININTNVESNNGSVEAPADIVEGESFTIRFIAQSGYRLSRVVINNTDMTNQVENNELTLVAGSDDLEIVATFVEESTSEEDAAIAVPDTGRFTNAEVKNGACNVGTIVASALIAVATMILVGGKFAEHKIDFSRK